MKSDASTLIAADRRQSSTVLQTRNGLIHGIIQQMTLALENQHLTEMAQQAAQRDRAIAEAANKIHRPTDLEAILRTAITEVSGITGVDEVGFQLGATRGSARVGASGNGKSQ